MNKVEKFFYASDWIACCVTFAVALSVYVLTLQPTVGLEDSGELIVASDYLGVPHPPGYPIWSLLTWFFQWVFHSVRFHGHPNPAWAVNLFSAVSGAAACGIISLLISRSGMDMLRSLKKESSILGEGTERLFCSVAGISGGLLLAFGQGMWSQAVIAEVYTLNIFFQSLVLVFLYRWMSRPEQSKWLLLCAFSFGLGITNHQTLMFMGLAIAAAVLCNELEIFHSHRLYAMLGVLTALLLCLAGIYFGSIPLQLTGVGGSIIACLLIRHPFMVRDFFITGSMYLLLVGFNKWAANYSEYAKYMWVAGPDAPGFWIWTLYALGVPILATFLLPKGKIVGPTFLVLLVGISFYFYMPLSSDQNPPINWGYPRTWEGFMHAIGRKQYERVKLASVFTPRFIEQAGTYFMDLRSQFYGPIALLAIIPCFFLRKFGKKNLCWIATTLVAFVSVGIVFIILQNPKTDIQSLFIGRVQYIQSHAIYVLWLGYGILLLMAYFEALVKNRRGFKVAGVAVVLLLPFALIYKNYNDKAQLKVVGGAEQNGHDFGWQFGNWQLQGVHGIEADMRAWYTPEEFEKQWADYPDKNYPHPMGTNAIFFGGTDPGRFVPTYMIYSAKIRPDVYLITQNALADNTYMNVMRDLYGDQIWIPSPNDSNRSFQMYIQGIRSGKINTGAEVKAKGGKIQVQGVRGVMEINGFLSKMIFDHNQYITETETDEATRSPGTAVVYADPVVNPETGLPPKRTFYVEESYVMPWMYPYLTPHGLIMKINNEPTPITSEIIRKDTEFWNWYVERLMNNQKFIRDIVARKSFSKLRSAIAGLYAARGKLRQSEAAFHQAVTLYDLSPEANFRLADLLSKQGRYDEAITLFDDFIAKDPNSEKAILLHENLKKMKTMAARQVELNSKLRSGKVEFKEIIELMNIQFNMGAPQQANALAHRMLNDKHIQPEVLMTIAQFMAGKRQFSTVELALMKYTDLKPKDPRGWINLAGLQLVLNKRSEMYISLHKAVEIGGEPVRSQLRRDQRFNSVRNTPEFQQIVPQKQTTVNAGISPFPEF